MGEESLVARLRAHCFCEDLVDAEQQHDGTWHGSFKTCITCEAADALERAEKERDEAREAISKVLAVTWAHDVGHERSTRLQYCERCDNEGGAYDLPTVPH